MNFSHITNVRRAETPHQKPSYKALKNQIKSKKTKPKVKIFSRYHNTNSHLNDLIEKMRCFKNILNKTTDLKSLLLIDTYGLHYSNELKKIINNVKKNIFPLPHHYDFSMKSKEKQKKDKKDKNDTKTRLYLSYKEKRKSDVKKEENNLDKVFDLSDLMNSNREKRLNKESISQSRKDKKLLNLKAQIFYLERGKFITNQKNNKYEFLRNNIKKNNYNKIQSKYKRPKTAIDKLKNKSKENNDLDSFNTPNYKSNIHNIDSFGGIDDNKANYDDNIDRMNYYNKRIKSSKIRNQIKKENFNILNESYKQNNITPNILLFKTSRLTTPHIPIRQKFKKMLFANNPKEKTVKSASIFNKSNRINHSLLLNPNKKYFFDELNNLEVKSNIIDHNFSYFSDKSQEIGKNFFNKSFQKIKNDELNIKEINQYFNFSKGFEKNLEHLLKKNAINVKKIIDPHGTKILDKVIKELCMEERILNKNYFLSFKEDKPEEKKQIMNKYNEMLKEGNSDILDIFQKKENDFFNDIRLKKNYVNDIEIMYRKAKIINKFGKKANI